MLGIRRRKTGYGTVWLWGDRVIWTRPDRTRMLRNVWAHLNFERDVRILKAHGVSLPHEAAVFWTGIYRMDQVRLDELHPDLPGYDSPSCGLEQSPFVCYLKRGELEPLREFCRRTCGDPAAAELERIVDSEKRRLAKLRGLDYDPSRSCLVIDERNVIVDGQHRAAVLYVEKGGGQVVSVVRAQTQPAYRRYFAF